jgi:hypothetical protein
MLGLGASHLALTSPNATAYTPSALSHRILAIRALNTALSEPAMCRISGDARLAAFMVLIFQSACLPRDGLRDYLTMLRGAVLQGLNVTVDSIFADFEQTRHVATMESLLEEEGAIVESLEESLVFEELDALQEIERILSDEGPERMFHGLLVESVNAAMANPRSGMFSRDSA